MAAYIFSLAGFVIINSCLFYWQRRRTGQVTTDEEVTGYFSRESLLAAKAVKWKFKAQFLPVYLLVFAADWLQGPYMYTLYKDGKGLAKETVVYLIISGFLAAAVFACFVGSLADRHGRRRACLVFCVAYSLSCLTVLFDSIPVLFAGRVFGGLSSTLMFSVFESWMVTGYHRQYIDDASGSLNDIFGLMTTLNAAVALLAAIFTRVVVDITRTQAAPFLGAVACLILAFNFIWSRWNESYGYLPMVSEKQQNGFKYILQDKRLWVLTLTTCCFEGPIYLFLIAIPGLILPQDSSDLSPDPPPFIILTIFTCATILGSLFFATYSSLNTKATTSTLLSITLVVASFCFIFPVLTHSEGVTFYCVCMFSVCCGIYFPSIASLRERIVEDAVRSRIYALMRIPLNVSVVFGLFLTRNGLQHQEKTFMVFSGAILFAALTLGSLVTE